jgi:hypothetical protein
VSGDSPRRLTSRDARRRARAVRDQQWRFMERAAAAGTLWFCPWNKERRPEGPDEYRTSLIGGNDVAHWIEKHGDWFAVGDWDHARCACPVRLTDAGRAALVDRAPWDGEDVEGGLVEPGYVCAPARARTRCYRLDALGDLRRIVSVRGVEGFHQTTTRSCSGCCELGESAGREHLYRYDERARCRVGPGCAECGFRGKRRDTQWIPFDPLEIEDRAATNRAATIEPSIDDDGALGDSHWIGTPS